MRLDLLSDHTVLHRNVSQFVPQAAAATAAGHSLVFGETNSVSCSGRSGISDTFGAALWAVDYMLLAASLGIPKVYFHLGAQSEYSAFVPIDYMYEGENLTAGVRSPWYAHYFLAHVVAGGDAGESQRGGANWTVAALPGANSSDLAGYAVYGGKGGDEAGHEDGDGDPGLAKLVFIDLGVYNSSEGLANPSTLSRTDNDDPEFWTRGARPTYNMSVETPWEAGRNVGLLRLSGPGTNAKSGVNVAGVTFDMRTGEKNSSERWETRLVEAGGVVNFQMVQAQAVLLELDGGPSLVSSMASRATSLRPVVAITMIAGLSFGLLLL